MHSETEDRDSQMIDTNSDSLDDRLFDNAVHEAQNVKDIMHRVHHIPIVKLNKKYLY